MSYTWHDGSRKQILGRVAKHLHDEGAKDLDGFSSRLISRIGDHVEKQGKFPNELELENVMTGIKTSLFRANQQLRKKDLTDWIAGLLAAQGGGAIRPIPIPSRSGPAAQAIRISIDDIDSFRQVQKVSSHEVASRVPLKIPESDIKESIAQIVGEPFVGKDWGGEIEVDPKIQTGG